MTSIDDYAFEDCSSLTSVDVPSSVTSIGEDAFPAWTVIRRVPSKHRLLVVWAVAVVGAAVLVAAMAECVR